MVNCAICGGELIWSDKLGGLHKSNLSKLCLQEKNDQNAEGNKNGSLV